MSTIKTTTLSTQGGSTVPVDTVVNGTAKAWVNFSGTGTVAIRRAFNVSSITDNGTGSFNVNFTTAMVDVDYVCIANASGTTDANNLQPIASVDRTASSVRVDVETGAAAQYDADLIDAIIFS